MGWIKPALLFLVFNLSYAQIIFGQDDDKAISTNDFWTGISLKHKLNKKVAFSLEQQIRIKDNLSSIQSNFFEFGAKYKMNKYFSTKVQYRYTIRNNQRNSNRYALDANAKWNIKPSRFQLDFRMRFQYSSVVFTGEPGTYLRNKIKLRYKLAKKIKLFGSYENFYKFDQHNEFRGNRYTVGLASSINKKFGITIFYCRDQKINKQKPETRNIIALRLNYEI